MLYPQSLFEDQGHDSGPGLRRRLAGIWRDAWAVCGIEMHRRCLSLGPQRRFRRDRRRPFAPGLEARNLMMGAELIHRRLRPGICG